MDTAAPITVATSGSGELPDLSGIPLVELARPGTAMAGTVADVVARLVGDTGEAGRVAHYSFSSSI